MTGQQQHYSLADVERIAALVWQDIAGARLPAVPWASVSEYHRNQFMRTVASVLRHTGHTVGKEGNQ